MNTITEQDFIRGTCELLNRVELGESFVVVRHGVPVAEVRPITPSPLLARPYGLAAGAFVVPDDFDCPLPEETTDAFEQ